LGAAVVSVVQRVCDMKVSQEITHYRVKELLKLGELGALKKGRPEEMLENRK
jgi:hypothetical protein